MTYREALALAQESANKYGEDYVVVLRANGEHGVDNARVTNPAMVVNTVVPTVEVYRPSPLAAEILRAQERADLYGLTYGVYSWGDGRYLAFPQGDTTMLGDVWEVGSCVSNSPILGKARLEEEVSRFMMTR
jgi:ABC-type transporter lipoprotein component MlaA